MPRTFKQLAFHFDQRKCTGCKACQIACKDKHDLPTGVTWRRVPEFCGGTWRVDESTQTFTQQVFTYYTSLSCNHCADPVCVQVCPSTAMRKGDNGVVSVDPTVCIGCRYCEMACPYHAPQFDADKGVMTKCDFCADRIAEGKAPACVAACPSRALDYGEADELRRKYGGTADIAPLPSPEITRPNLFITPHGEARPSGSKDGSLANPSEA
ncbi:DMSO/selenate family reductase complex B subunit [Austwickia chelonae]|uniref:DMSO/selenate family reductase complex B subunit n=1 Tax=Austwickia chelonae TaxID=100225 RepID=UPI000E25D85C|nr:DMSO/selenate family reductase complex B subunit [Austwickia chelonae]